MGPPLRLLIVEDSPDDADLVLRELRRGGYEPSYQRVEETDEFIRTLESQEWDMILCDYTLPGFSGTQALSLVRSRGIDVPFIFVSGTIGEETAVSAMRAGAQDYVVKDNLRRLVPAVERELRDLEMRREHAKAEAERRIAETRFREILAMAPDAIVAVDENQKICIFNRAAETLFGYSIDEATGQLLDLLLPSQHATAHRQHVSDFAGGPSIVKRMNERGEVIGRRKNGEEFPAEASLSKIADSDQAIYMAVIRDISERKRDEATLRKLSRAVDHSSNLIVITDREGRIEYANTRLLESLGYDASEIVGKTPAIWKSRKTNTVEYAELWKAILSGNDWRGEFENRRKDGTLISVSATISPIRDDNGEATHFISIQEDITHRKELEEQLRQAQKMEALGQLTGGLAHDFNNLLTVIISNLDLLQEELQETPNAREMANLALGASLRGAALTRQLLAFSRRQPLESRVLDLNTLVTGTTGLLRRTLGEQIEVKMDLAADLWTALADPTQVESALANLAINARDAMPDGGCLTIETANCHLDADYAEENLDVSPGDYVMLAVTDTGTGIPADALEHVFEPFFTTKEQDKGTGLGLSMVYGFAKQSRGHVKIESEIDHGTTVRLFLPRTEEQVSSPEESTSTLAREATTQATILVVEDNVAVRRVVMKQLISLGYDVITAEDTIAAMEVLSKGEHIDLLFTDVVMPGGMSGFDLADYARKTRPGMSILFTSGFAELTLQDQTGSGETKHLLSKPYRFRDLARKIQEVLQEEKG